MLHVEYKLAVTSIEDTGEGEVHEETLAFVSGSARIVGGGFYTDDAYGLVLSDVERELSTARLALLGQLDRERSMAETVVLESTDDLERQLERIVAPMRRVTLCRTVDGVGEAGAVVLARDSMYHDHVAVAASAGGPWIVVPEPAVAA